MKIYFRFVDHIKRSIQDSSGTAVIEFAFIAPLLIGIYFSSVLITDAISAYRKVTLTARTVADLVSQQSTMTTSDVTQPNLDSYLKASANIMAPYSNSTLVLTVTEVCVAKNGSDGTSATPGWQTIPNAANGNLFSRTINNGNLVTSGLTNSGGGAIASNFIPNGYNAVSNSSTTATKNASIIPIAQNDTCYIKSTANFSYVPRVLNAYMGTIPMSDVFISTTRNVTAIPITS